MTEEIYYILSSALTCFSMIIALVGVIFACIQIKQVLQNRNLQYDNERRNKTVELVIHYTQQISKETKCAEKIVSSLSEEQCKKLYESVPFSIDGDIKEQLCTICPNRKQCKNQSGMHKKCLCYNSKNEYIVEGPMLTQLREYIISYLNTLECVLLAWKLGIVEQDVIEEQFLFLDKKRQQERALEAFRTIAGGGHSYPAIELFYQHLDDMHSKKLSETLKDIIE